MELVDIYNDKHELQNYTKERDKLIDKEYRLSCYIWIINDKDQILIQQRLATAKICPNMWETASGAAKTGETALLAITRELEEEIGIKANKEDIKYIGSYVRVNDFVEVFLLKTNIDTKELILQQEEVQAVKWVTISEYEELINTKLAVDTSFIIFKQYYDKFYNAQIVIENGMRIFKKI